MIATLEVALRLVGAFYVFAGLAALRAAAMDRMMDQMLSAISLKPQPPREAQRRWLWTVSALAIGMGGAALAVLSLWAMPLFAIGLATQAFYLVWARTAFPPENAEEEKGRRQTIHAALLYGVATLAVCAAGAAGLLQPWHDPWALVAPATGLFMLATIGRHLVWSAKKPGVTGPGDDAWPEPEPRADVRRVRLEPLWIGLNLVDADTGEGLDAFLYSSEAIGNRIYHWALAFHATEDETDQRLWIEFASPAEEAAHRAEGAAIVADLETIYGRGNVDGPVYPADIRYSG